MHGTALAAAALVIAAAACGPPRYPPSTGHPLLGAPMPAIRATSIDGHAVEVGAQSGPVLVKFFADYCAPCKETLPAAERVHDAYPDVVFVGVDEDESREVAADVARHYELTFPVVHDASNALAERFGVSSMPMTFVADASGAILWVGGAGQTEGDLRAAVRAARARR
jgi:thiol-disulfide isomerase/thioredoxin